MSPEELFGRLKCSLVPAEDVDGNPIAELAGLHFKPLDVEDAIAVSEYRRANGHKSGYKLIFARALVYLTGEKNPDGSPVYARVIPDERASELAGSLDGPVERAIERIRFISGHLDDEEKKTAGTGLTGARSSPSSSGLPVT